MTEEYGSNPEKAVEILNSNINELQQNDLVLSHVQTCDKCNSRLNESRKLHKVLTSLSPRKHPSYLHGSIMSRLQTVTCKKKRS